MANVELLESTMQYIKDHPEGHDQTVWTCETGACFAGHAVLRNGYRASTRIDMWGNRIPVNGVVIDDKGEHRPVDRTAQRLLGLSDEDADIMFSAYNTADQLELMVKDLANGEELHGNWVREVEYYHQADGEMAGRSFWVRKGERVDA